ncbi:hypothetical protein [Pseudomonas syringae]|uniref:hypothetical protein n=1 Tax=Pseudomonas syringae TaxID=317 RepID=UPI0002099AA3|nr:MULTISPECIES: hypothetical protein [Pseudomonas syringae group]EGH97642.1 hypothetical protein PLA106_16199 [Pseudomonas amygdali pv. lachrymans str. M302278]PYD04670.1 hypothetical protein DND90_11255 [Pseudomonas syringae pv. maculicola]RMM16899.1 hypothetical protein ALQ85_102845 [Pseudomonas syringae]
MKPVRLFETSASADDVFSEVLSAGIAGVHGGRVSVRGLAGQVGRLAEREGVCVSQDDGYISAGQTYNHARAELAYMYDQNKFDEDGALQAVIEAFEKSHPFTD